MAKNRVRQESNRVPAKPDCVEPRRGPRQRRAANAEDDRVLAELARTEAERIRVLAEDGRYAVRTIVSSSSRSDENGSRFGTPPRKRARPRSHRSWRCLKA